MKAPRGSRDTARIAHSGRKRVLCLGDSHQFVSIINRHSSRKLFPQDIIAGGAVGNACESVTMPHTHPGAACVCAVFLPQRRAVIGFEALPDYQSISFRQQECATMNTPQALIRQLLCKMDDARFISRKRPGILKKFHSFLAANKSGLKTKHAWKQEFIADAPTSNGSNPCPKVRIK